MINELDDVILISLLIGKFRIPNAPPLIPHCRTIAQCLVLTCQYECGKVN